MELEEDRDSKYPGRISSISNSRSDRHSIGIDEGDVAEYDINSLIGKTLFDQFLVNDVIGQGGMSVVYRARQKSDGRSVAIKTLKFVDKALSKRFLREIEIHKRLKHPNIVKPIHYGTGEDGKAYFVMEILTGRSIEDLFETKVRFTKIDEIVHIINSVCDALSYAHALGIIHRDIKPANVILSVVNGEKKVSVVDFGLAKLYEDLQKITKTGQVLGSPIYMSPEQCMGNDLDPRSDIYSLAVVVYEMVTGTLPFEARTPVAMMEAHCDKSYAPTPIKEKTPNFPFADQLHLVIRKAMETEPEERFQTIDQFRVAFNAWHSMCRSGEDSGFFDQPAYEKYLNGDEASESKEPATSSSETKSESGVDSLASPFKRPESFRKKQILNEVKESQEKRERKKAKSEGDEEVKEEEFSSAKLQSLVDKKRKEEITKRTQELDANDSFVSECNPSKVAEVLTKVFLFVFVVLVFAGGTVFFCLKMLNH